MPSPTRRRIASRTGVREVPSASAICHSVRRVPAAKSPEITLAQVRVGLVSGVGVFLLHALLSARVPWCCLAQELLTLCTPRRSAPGGIPGDCCAVLATRVAHCAQRASAAGLPCNRTPHRTGDRHV